MKAPDIEKSTKEDRQKAIQNMFRCISDCDSCGLCKIFKGKDPSAVFQDYIEGKCSFQEISRKL